MHIHNNPVSQLTQAPIQPSLRAIEARKAAAVRTKLTSFAATDDGDLVSRVETESQPDPQQRKNPPQDEEAFRSVFFSISV